MYVLCEKVDITIGAVLLIDVDPGCFCKLEVICYNSVKTQEKNFYVMDKLHTHMKCIISC